MIPSEPAPPAEHVVLAVELEELVFNHRRRRRRRGPSPPENPARSRLPRRSRPHPAVARANPLYSLRHAPRRWSSPSSRPTRSSRTVRPQHSTDLSSSRDRHAAVVGLATSRPHRGPGKLRRRRRDGDDVLLGAVGGEHEASGRSARRVARASPVPGQGAPRTTAASGTVAFTRSAPHHLPSTRVR